MYRVKFDGVMEKFYSKKLTDLVTTDGKPFTATELKYTGEYDAYGEEKKNPTDADWDVAYAEMVAAGVTVSKEDMVKAVNNRNKATARSKGMQLAADAAGLVKPDIETDRELQIAAIVKGLAGKKLTPEAARARAIAILDAE